MDSSGTKHENCLSSLLLMIWCQVLQSYQPGPPEQCPTNQIHNNKLLHWYTLLCTHPGMILPTSTCRYFHARIFRQGPETIQSTLSLQTTSLPTYSRRSQIWGNNTVYCASRHITTSFSEGNHRRPRNHRHPPLLCSSRRSHPTYHTWYTWLSTDEANYQHLTRHQSLSKVCC